MVTLKTTYQVAAILSVSPRRVRALAKKRGIGSRYGGRDWLFTDCDIEALRPGKAGRPKLSKA